MMRSSPLGRRLARASDRGRRRNTMPLRGQPLADFPGQRDRGGAGIDDALARPQVRLQRRDHARPRPCRPAATSGSGRTLPRSAPAGRAVTPCAASRSSGSGRDRAPGQAGRRRRARWPHIGSPMTPRPMKPIRETDGRIGLRWTFWFPHRDVRSCPQRRCGCQRSGGDGAMGGGSRPGIMFRAMAER